jgi:hypothetical protein
MAYFDSFRRKEPSKFRQFIQAITPDWWDDLWWEKHSYGNHNIVFGREYYIKKTFKTGNLALIVALGLISVFIIYFL